MSSPLPILPPEVIVHTLSMFLESDLTSKESLKNLFNCCLVNRTWRQYSQPLLFSELRSFRFQDTQRLERAFDRNPQVGSFVKFLEVCYSSCRLYMNASVTSIARRAYRMCTLRCAYVELDLAALECLYDLKHLALDSCRLNCSAPVDATFPSIRKLELTSVYPIGEDELKCYSLLLRGLVNIQSLTVERFSGMKQAQFGGHFSPLMPNLLELTLDEWPEGRISPPLVLDLRDYDYPMMLNFTTLLPLAVNLRFMDLYIYPITRSKILHLIPTCLPQLQNLALHTQLEFGKNPANFMEDSEVLQSVLRRNLAEGRFFPKLKTLVFDIFVKRRLGAIDLFEPLGWIQTLEGAQKVGLLSNALLEGLERRDVYLRCIDRSGAPIYDESEEEESEEESEGDE